MSNSINTSATQSVATSTVTGSDNDPQSKNAKFILALEEMKKAIEQELKKAEPDFKQLEKNMASFFKNHKTLFGLLNEADSLKNKNPNDFTAQQKKDMEKLTECFNLLQECSKFLAAIKRYINELETLMNNIANGVQGTKHPVLNLNNLAKNDYQLTLPSVPGTSSTSKV